MQLGCIWRTFAQKRFRRFYREEGLSFLDGRRFRALTFVDDCTRECLALIAELSLSGVRVARELDAV